MVWLYYLVLGPVVAGIVLALAFWLLRGRTEGFPRGSAGASSLAAGLLLLLVGVAVLLIAGPLGMQFDMPMEFFPWYWDYQFRVPLLLGIVGMVVLAFPVRARNGRDSAQLTPRTPMSFTSWPWLLAPSLVLMVILIITVTAGNASQPDNTGRYTMYSMEFSGGLSVGTGIYGWFYSVPCLVLLGVMIVIAILDLFLIARPALEGDHGRDVHVRTVRTRNVLMVGTGALLWHLGLVFTSLAGTASLRGNFGSSAGNMTFWPTFAALEPALNAASSVAVALGFAFWFTVVLSTVPSRQRARTVVRL